MILHASNVYLNFILHIHYKKDTKNRRKLFNKKERPVKDEA